MAETLSKLELQTLRSLARAIAPLDKQVDKIDEQIEKLQAQRADVEIKKGSIMSTIFEFTGGVHYQKILDPDNFPDLETRIDENTVDLSPVDEDMVPMREMSKEEQLEQAEYLVNSVRTTTGQPLISKEELALQVGTEEEIEAPWEGDVEEIGDIDPISDLPFSI